MKDANYFFKIICEKGDSSRCANTCKTYSYSLAWLAKRMEEFETGTPTPEEVIAYLDNSKVTDSRKMLSYTAMKVFHNVQGETEDSAKYCAPLLESKKAIDASYDNQTRTDKQEKNWVEHSCLKKYTAALRKSTLAYDKNKLWTKDQYADATLAFILQVHMTFPIRRDLVSVQWGSNFTDADNYIDDATHEIVLNKHKTSRWHGTNRLKMSRPMWRLAQLLRKQQKMRSMKSGNILLNRYWRKMSPNGFSTWMKREMKKCPGCEDKSVGCLILRHCVITHKNRNAPTIKQNREFAAKCMHSTTLNARYRVDPK